MRNHPMNFTGLPCKRDDCSLEVAEARSTLMGWERTFDKSGNPTAEDPNAHTDTIKCATCKTTWERVEKEGKDNQWLEMQPDQAAHAASEKLRGIT